MKDEKSKITAVAIEKMIDFYQGNLRDIEHFLKVWAYAKTIGEQESVDENTQGILELAAVVHDISCPLCREKYGNTNGKNQELESEPLVKEFFEEMPVSEQKVERIIWLVTHHHTYTNIDGIDYQILIEADFLVNASESNFSKVSIENATRLLGYLYRISDPRPEDVVDEMLAFLSDRNAIIQKKELEHAQATINKVYREGL